MTRTQRSGAVVAIAGVLLLVVGAAGLLSSDSGTDGSADRASADASTSAATSTSPVSTIETSTSESATTATPSTTSTTVSVITTEVADEFIVRYADAIGAGDADTLLSLLHPVVIAQEGADRCRAYIEEEILTISEYQRSGEVSATTERAYGDATLLVADVPISLVYRGRPFDVVATLTLDGSEVRWFSECA